MRLHESLLGGTSTRARDKARRADGWRWRRPGKHRAPMRRFGGPNRQRLREAPSRSLAGGSPPWSRSRRCHPRVVGWSLGGRRREATRAIPARHIGARTDLDPADGSPPDRRAARVAGLPRRAPGTAAACRRQSTPRSRVAACASTCTSTGRRRRAPRQTRFPDRPTGLASAERSGSPVDGVN